MKILEIGQTTFRVYEKCLFTSHFLKFFVIMQYDDLFMTDL